MKKIIVMCVCLVLAVSFGVTALAAEGFISSPEASKNPTLVSAVVEADECDATFTATGYANRANLSAANKSNIEKSYSSITGAASDLTKLNADLAALAKKRNIPVKNLAVSDLFDISSANCLPAEHASHGKTTFKLETDTLSNFVGIMLYDGSKWQLIDGAKVSGKSLTFTSKDFGSFAIVVSKETLSPETGDFNLAVITVVMLISAAGAVVCVKKLKGLKA